MYAINCVGSLLTEMVSEGEQDVLNGLSNALINHQFRSFVYGAVGTQWEYAISLYNIQE